MSNEMVERVAKTFSKYMSGSKDGWKSKVTISKLVILAMREPTERMIDAGAYDLDMTLKQQYQNMIDAALKDD